MPELDTVEFKFDSTLERYDPEKYQPRVSLNPEYVHNPAQIKEQMNSLSDKRVTLLGNSKNGALSLNLIDSAIRIRSIATTYAQHRSTLWKSDQNEHLFHRNLAAGAAVLAVACAFLFSKDSTSPAVSFVVGIICGLGAAYEWYQAYDAGKQIALWNHSPVVNTAKLREKAYDQGFLYIYQNDLKFQNPFNGVLHPLEVKTFYEQYVPEFFQTMLSQEPINDDERHKWLSSFCTSNPMSLSLMRYGLGEIPADLRPFSAELELLINEIQANPDQMAPLYTRTREFLLKADQAWKSRPST
jgi:hypothetical protein